MDEKSVPDGNNQLFLLRIGVSFGDGGFRGVELFPMYSILE
jgi:hypothetical protein